MSHVYRVRIPDLDTGVILKLRGKLYVQAHTTELPGGGWTAFYVEQRGVIDLPDEEPE